MRGRFWTSIASVASLALLCGSVPVLAHAKLGKTREPVVYGRDARHELFEEPNAALRNFAMTSVVALVARERLQNVGDSAVALEVDSWSESAGLCEGERFGSQPAAAHCSGTLVGPDLVLTAGHCFDLVPCANTAFVFDFFYASPDSEPRLTRRSVRGCSELLEREVSLTSSATRVDYAWARLDARAEIAPTPLVLRPEAEPLLAGEQLLSIGFPGGVPAKIDDGGLVYDPRPELLDYFVSSVDAFHGSSGAPVLDASLRLVGILARGNDDFELGSAGCQSGVRLPEDANAAGEEATYAARAVDAACPGAGPDLTRCLATSSAPKLTPHGGCRAAGGWAGSAPSWRLLAVCLVAWLLRRAGGTSRRSMT